MKIYFGILKRKFKLNLDDGVHEAGVAQIW